MSRSLFIFVVIYAIAVPLKNVCCWPVGTYGIPMPITGCPETAKAEWTTGMRTHQTEQGSKASENIHLAGLTNNTTNQVIQKFCMKTSRESYEDHIFEPGSYCIFKLGVCPEGFREGWIHWDDKDVSWFDRSRADTQSGTRPDGSYSKNTKIYYCCRNDGLASKPLIHLPTDLPFYLLKWGDSCQKVKGMHVTEEWVFWSDESDNNHNAEGGLHPAVVRQRQSDKSTTLFYCYYETKTDHTAIPTVIVTVLVIVVLISLATIAVYIIKRRKNTNRNRNTDPPAELTRFTNDNTEVDVGSASPKVPSAPPEEECVLGSPGGGAISPDDVFRACAAEETSERREQAEQAPLVFTFPGTDRPIRLPTYDEALQEPTCPLSLNVV